MSRGRIQLLHSSKLRFLSLFFPSLFTPSYFMGNIIILTAEISIRNSHPNLEGPFATHMRAPFAEPVVIPENDPTTNEAIAHNEAVEQRSPESPAVESSSSLASVQRMMQEPMLEPTVYVPPTRPRELEDVIVQSPREAVEDQSRSSSSSSSSSSSG
ncbi:hypothetical protein GGI43DRAFT_387079 [Trichoderma evansii]